MKALTREYIVLTAFARICSCRVRRVRVQQLQQVHMAVLDRPRVRVRTEFVECIPRSSRFQKQSDLPRCCEIGGKTDGAWRRQIETVFRLPLAAARCSGVALCISKEPGLWPASSRICARANVSHEPAKSAGNGHLNKVFTSAVCGRVQSSPLLALAHSHLSRAKR